jgi:predicted nicotinamide N-methyase
LALSGEVELLVGNVRMKKMVFSSSLYVAQSDQDGSGPTPFAEQIAETDLAPGEYEGGFKLWECGQDLTMFLDHISAGQPDFWTEKAVVELGCGHAIPSLYCLLRGAKEVAFQDYNEEVLEQLTSPTIAENLGEASPDRVRLFSGDWSLLHTVMPFQHYDVILSSDTLYCQANHGPFLRLIKHLLKPGGIA